MPKTYSISDAVKLLGKRENALVDALDKLAGTALLGGVAWGVTDLLGWFDAKTEFVRLCHQLLVKAGEKRSGLSRYSASERLHAAHTVIVIVALFDALKQVDLPFKLKEIRLDKDGQRALVGLTSIFDGNGVLPCPSRPYELNLKVLKNQYEQACHEFGELLHDGAIWARLSAEHQARTEIALSQLHGRALLRYEELIRQLTVQYPELAFWLQSHHNAHVTAGLQRLEATLEATRVGTEPDERRLELSNHYRSALSRPIINTDQVPAGLEIPLTCDAYVDPDYQVCPMTEGARPALLASWCDIPARSDLHRYLAGYLTSPKAVTHPLVVLGDPGSGKSLLTKVLAARLPASDYFAVRVELRTAAAEADLHRQINYGLSEALHEDVTFAELSRTAGDALPVVLLDGFDELLQATGVRQTDFLHRVQAFQRERAELGKPVAVVVTSRISVSGGMQIPVDSDVLRLIPFTDSNIKTWLDVWNASNADYFAEHDLAPLPQKVVLDHRGLAVQPLLLLMLALYDAVDNALQRHQDSLGRVVLYEKLLSRFARREVDKDTRRATSDLDLSVEYELARLSVVAFAMFQRGVQWVSDRAINEDMAALLSSGVAPPTHGIRTPLSEGDKVVGRFFFVQCARATRDETRLHTYEFLHATFGEFLVARFTWYVLNDLHKRESSGRRIIDGLPDDNLLCALLSFAPLTASTPVIEFLSELACGSDNREELKLLVRRLLALSQLHRARSLDTYQPVSRSAPARYAIYSLNLVLLHVVLARVCESTEIGIEDWSKLTMFWKGQLSDTEWRTLIESLYVRWENPPHVTLAIGSQLPETAEADRLAKRVSLREAALDARFTGDAAANEFKYAFEALPESRFDVEYATALIQLTSSPMPPDERAEHYLRWCDHYPDLVLQCLHRDVSVTPETLRLLAKAELGVSSQFIIQLCERIGRGGPDDALLEVFDDLQIPRVNGGFAPQSRAGFEGPLLDAWLRLYEAGYRHPDHRHLDLRTVLTSVDYNRIAEFRPDLLFRAGTVAHEVGLFD